MGTKDIVTVMRSEEVLTRFAEVLGDREAKAFISSVLLAVRNSDVLMQCEPLSIVSSALRAATLRLSCDPATGHAHLVPFSGKATLVIGYKGYKHMAIRTGQYRYINEGRLYDGQEWVVDQMTGQATIEGGPTPEHKIIGRFAYFETLKGYSKSLYMTLEEIHAHARKYSKSYDNPKSLWQTDPASMERKTVLRLLLVRDGLLDPIDSLNISRFDEAEEVEPIEIAVVETPTEPEPQQTEAEILHDLGFNGDRLI